MFLVIASVVGQRSTCPRAGVGALIVKDGRIISMGYNGSPSKQPHCYDVGCQIEHDHCVRTIHAEANAIAFAARAGVRTEDATMFTTHGLCLKCAHLCVSAGIREVVYRYKYDDVGLELLFDAGVIVRNYAPSS
jgi:dCMP deaminase